MLASKGKERKAGRVLVLMRFKTPAHQTPRPNPETPITQSLTYPLNSLNMTPRTYTRSYSQNPNHTLTHSLSHIALFFFLSQAVGESVSLPLLYYQNNIMSTLVLLEELGKTSCRNFVFSSSATVYGTSPSPITESSKVGDGITNPYGKESFLE